MYAKRNKSNKPTELHAQDVNARSKISNDLLADRLYICIFSPVFVFYAYMYMYILTIYMYTYIYVCIYIYINI